MNDELEVSDQELRRMSRRGFFLMAAGAAAGYGGWKLLRTRAPEDGLAWPLRRVLGVNESLSEAYFSKSRLSPEFPPSAITRPRRNGNLGLAGVVDPAAWRLTILGAATPISLTLADIQALPRHDMITELRCIEGWSIVVKWTGARLGDLIARFPPREDVSFVSMETPDRGYYVGLDMPSALHPQTLLAYGMNDRPLAPQHGAPLRLAIPVKYGIKNIKRIGTIRYAATRPADFWAERGYDWYAGH